MFTTALITIVLCVFMLQTSVGQYNPRVTDRWNSDLLQHKDNFRQGKHDGHILKRVNSLKRQAEQPQYVTLDQYNRDNKAVRHSIDAISAMISKMSAETEAIVSQQKEQREAPTFYGRFQGVVHYNNGEVYKFNEIVTKSGSGSYSSDTGKYTCGQDGYYLVSVMLFANGLSKGDNSLLYGNLFKDNEWLSTVHSKSTMYTGPYEYDGLQASTTVIVKCLKENTLFVIGNAGGDDARTDSGAFTIMFIHP